VQHPRTADLEALLRALQAGGVRFLGPLDVLCRLHDDRGYDELVSRSREIVDDELRLRVLDLDALIEIKAATGRVKDQLVVPLLMALRDRSPGESS